MNLPNKITFVRIILTLLIVIILLFPFDALGISSTKLFINEAIVVDIKYFIAGVIFVFAVFSDFIDGFIARKYNMTTNLGKMLDVIADKFLVNSILIILTSQGLIHSIIPVIIITMDIVVDVIKGFVGNQCNNVTSNKTSKIRNFVLMFGIVLTLFNNLPFELINIKVSDVILVIACVLSVYATIQFYQENKKIVLN